jgi:hypothetical protein
MVKKVKQKIKHTVILLVTLIFMLKKLSSKKNILCSICFIQKYFITLPRCFNNLFPPLSKRWNKKSPNGYFLTMPSVR